MPRGPLSSRSSKVTASFGLVSVPLEVFAGTCDYKISRQMTHVVPVMEEIPDAENPGQTVLRQKVVKVTQEDGTVVEVGVTEDHEVGYQDYDKVTGEVLTRNQVVHKIRTDYGPVYVEDHEIERLFSLQPNSLNIKEFQPQFLLAMGHYVPKGLHYVTPARSEVTTGKKKSKMLTPAVAKAYAVLMGAMKAKNAMALCDFVQRGIPQPALLLPDGTLWTVRFAEEVRERPVVEPFEAPAAEIKMAESLINMLWSDKPAVVENHRVTQIQTFADEKARAGNFGRAPEPEVAPVQTEEATDFAALMQASIDAIKAQQASA